MDFFDSITAQPDSLTASAAAVRDQLTGLPRLRGSERVVVGLVGIGGNLHAARGAAAVWRTQGLSAYALDAGDLQHVGHSPADVYFVLSESGQSTETAAAVEQIGADRCVAITNAPESPIATTCAKHLFLDSGPDAPVYTTGYSATLQALAIVGDALAPSASGADIDALPDQARALLGGAGGAELSPLADDRIVEVVDAARGVDVVGAGGSLASAGEGALMMRESAHLLTAFHQTHNYLHGPMEPVGPGVACVVVGDGREQRLARDLIGLGCDVVHIATKPVADAVGAGIAVPGNGGMARAALEIIAIQTVAAGVARRRGLTVEGFRYEQKDTKLNTREAD